MSWIWLDGVANCAGSVIVRRTVKVESIRDPRVSAVLNKLHSLPKRNQQQCD